ncbi:fasciclin domain-containing protein [Bizionia gelidisalsuginis]|uniref:Fasciclin domain-containing protein n=1 Tax=Bizionia gelidisalsuginis TaxID=291188 RepID=A0ABY3MDJ0_9FLAO|nr:fasciclin domain-containing protein [Bizionia gelidisalsuginis]TYC17041.1 fasciclin domain-containing protein [Bizionia gelidisalsuginis]
MKTIKKSPLLYVLVVLLFWSCNSDDDNSAPLNQNPETGLNIVQTAQANANLSSLVAAVIEANLDVTLSGSGPFTVLAPSNAAFAEFLSANGWATVADIPDTALEQTLLNHVISGTITSSDLVGLGAGYTSTLATGAGDNAMSLYFETSSGVLFNNVSTVTTADVEATNGIIHVVDKVITLPSVVEHAAANTNFSSLVTALGAADGELVNVLSGVGPFTILAPANDAFTTYLNGTALADVPTDVLSQLLLNHVINGELSSTLLSDLGSGYSNTNATGAGSNAMSIYYTTNNNVMFNGSATVTTADVIGTNGIIHAVDTVIELPTLATFATSNPALSSLVAALQLADSGTPTVPYIATLSDATSGPFTVFAPTNDAFADVLLELDPSGNTTLADVDPVTVDAILTYHIVNANVQSSQLVSGTVTTLGGDITANAGTFTLTDANLRVSTIIPTLIDIQATNGVAHAIDTVILPPQ